MHDQAPQRPTAITVICVLMALGTVAVIPALFVAGSMLPGWYTPFLLASSVVGIACMIGLWTMKKWAVYVYTAMTLVGQIVMLSTGLWTPMSIIVPAIVIAIMFANLGKMR
jgi:hypothetical protein